MTDKTAFRVLVVIVIMAGILAFWALLWPGEVWGGTHTERIRVTAYSSDPDSTMIRVWEVGSGDQVGGDSITTTYPDSFDFTLDSQKVYKVESYERWWGSGVWGKQSTRDISLRKVVASATLSDGDIAKVMDSIRTEHGDGSYLTGGAGTGTNDIRYYALDTSGTDELIHQVQLTVRTITGNQDATLPTNTSGYRDFTSPPGSLVTSGAKLGYVWIPDTANRSGNATDTIFGYNVAIDPAPSPNFCRVYGWATIGVGYEVTPVVQFTPKGDTAFERCDSTFFDPRTVIANTSNHADSIGYFWIDLRYSACVGDYDMVVGDLSSVKITVPSQSTWRVVW